GDAVEAHRTTHEESIARIPHVLALLSPEQRLRRTPKLDALLLVEDVLLNLLPVVVAAKQHLLHEGVELGRRRGTLREDGPRGDKRHERCQSEAAQSHRTLQGRPSLNNTW